VRRDDHVVEAEQGILRGPVPLFGWFLLDVVELHAPQLRLADQMMGLFRQRRLNDQAIRLLEQLLQRDRSGTPVR
jgi:hypothetical protein